MNNAITYTTTTQDDITMHRDFLKWRQKHYLEMRDRIFEMYGCENPKENPYMQGLQYGLMLAYDIDDEEAAAYMDEIQNCTSCEEWRQNVAKYRKQFLETLPVGELTAEERNTLMGNEISTINQSIADLKRVIIEMIKGDIQLNQIYQEGFLHCLIAKYF